VLLCDRSLIALFAIAAMFLHCR